MIRALVVALLLLTPAMGQDAPVFPPKDASGKLHPVFWTVAKAPKFDFPKSIWFGYPVAQVAKLEKEVEKGINAERAKHGLKPLVALEELRFLGRVHAREWGALGGGGHESKLWGHVSDRGAVLFGWRPSQWVLANGANKHQLCDNYMGGGSSARSYVTGWMNSSGHKRAILWKGNDHFGMSIARTKAHLMFAGLPNKTLKKVMALQPLYERLAAETKASKVKKLLGKIVGIREGSSAMRIAPMLLDSDPKVRLTALKALVGLCKLVPAAKLSIFALVDLGLPNSDPAVAKKAREALEKITRQKHEDAAAWRKWWHTDAHKRLR
jgi:uncharacterized protein YkwD